jgi:hypothetical protein
MQTPHSIEDSSQMTPADNTTTPHISEIPMNVAKGKVLCVRNGKD